MPTYEYVCEKCHKEFEVFQSMKDPRLTDCQDAACGGHVKRKLGTGAGIIFKGSGFYTTDYRSDSYKKSASADSASSTPAAAPAAAAATPAPAAAAPSTSSSGGSAAST